MQTKINSPTARCCNLNSGASGGYELKVEIPEHEKDNVKVFVKDDKMIIAGSRSFDETVKKKTSLFQQKTIKLFAKNTNSNIPVYEKTLIKEYDQGVLTVKVPKIGKAYSLDYLISDLTSPT